MDYLINLKIPSALFSQVQSAAKSLEISANSYLQQALHEKIGQWIDNQPSRKTKYDPSEGVPSRAMLPDELLAQTERAAADFGLSVDEFLHQALQEKVRRLPEDIAHKEEMDRAIEHILEKNGDLFRRLAEWPIESIGQALDHKPHVTKQRANP
jgi:predicted HicB family RNase H-like nuclease